MPNKLLIIKLSRKNQSKHPHLSACICGLNYLYCSIINLHKLVIICIDDEQTILDSLKIELERALEDEYIIETAESGQEALELLSELLKDNYSVAVAIADYIMPRMKGDELLIKIHEQDPKIFNILLTG